MDDDETDYVHDDPVVDAALDWFVRLRDAEEDPQILAGFRVWLAQDPRHETEFRALEIMWGSNEFPKAVQTLPNELPDIIAGYSTYRPTKWVKRLASAAAVVLVTVGLWQYPKLMLEWRADYFTATGEQSTIQLPDGSTMILNTDTAIAVDFENGRRDIALLQGEAWFDVQHDPEHPFRVSGGYGRAVVKGTSFSVRREDDRDEVVLERGWVDVTCLCDNPDQVELHPGEGAEVTEEGPQAASLVNPEQALAWREGRIMFEEAQLGHIVDELSRYYGGRILVSRDSISRLLVTGNYRLDDIEAAIRTLADAAGVTMTRVPGGLIILR
ncbi:FecR family protein [Paracoccus sp. 12-3]|nr:FecR family protein [Paracoccus xiamenensis]